MSRQKNPGLIWISLLAACALSLLPISDSAAWFQPYWLALVMIYWCLESPANVGLGTAFAVGLLLDLSIGSLLGQHALSLVIMTYLVSRFRLRVRFFPLWQQAIAIFILLLNDRFIYAWIHSLAGKGLPDWRIVIGPFIAMLIWPWLFLLLDEIRQRVKNR